jgi:hypothetical protein
MVLGVAQRAHFGACHSGGGGGSPAAPPPVTQPPASRAEISVTQTAEGQVCISPLVNRNVRIVLPMRITESAGLGFHVNAIRLTLFLNGQKVERSEMTSTDIKSLLGGNNHLAARSSTNIKFMHDVVATVDSYDALGYLLRFKDDNDNETEMVLNPPFDVITLFFCTI